MAKTKKSYEFEAEITQLLDIMINSLYSNKDIFLRELISNASDALDKLRYRSLTDSKLLNKTDDLEINIETDSANRTLTISDNGIGMSKDDVVKNIGTIAKSGTAELSKKINAEKNNKEQLNNLIGHFGVGFYSAFMVAEKVEITTKKIGSEKGVRWFSEGKGSYSIEHFDKKNHGTTIKLFLKSVPASEGTEDFTDKFVISKTVKKYSDFINYPINFIDLKIDEENNKQLEQTKETLNLMKPLWYRSKNDVNNEEYNEFYKHIAQDFDEPLSVLHLKAEGNFEYRTLIYIPGKASNDLFYKNTKTGLQLYSKGVLIMNNCAELLPNYLRFLKGVVDSTDLPLNISRQSLQQDNHIIQIRKWLTKKILNKLIELKEKNHDKYRLFWEQFGGAFKEGINIDTANKDKILSLLLFKSSFDSEKLTSLKDYVERMKDENEEIYYLTGESLEVIRNSPHLEAFRERGYEILFLTDPVDEIIAHALNGFEGKKLKSVGKGEIQFGDNEDLDKKDKELKGQEKDSEDFFSFLQNTLETHISQVRFTNRLTESPACLVVNSEIGESPFLEKMLMRGKGGGIKQKKILELNPNNSFILKFKERFEGNNEDSSLKDYAQLLFGFAVLAEGSDLPDVVAFNKSVQSLMTSSI